MSLIAKSQQVLVVAFLGGAGLLWATSAEATCRIRSPTFVAQDVSVDMGVVSVPPNLAVGAVIATKRFPIKPLPNNSFVCDLFGSDWSELQVLNRETIYTHTWKSDVPGVAFRISHELVYWGGSVGSFYYYNQVSYRPGQMFGIPATDLVFELVKIADVTGAGAIAPPGMISRQYIASIGPSQPILTASIRGEGVVIAPTTCKVDVGGSNVAVNFGSISAGVFAGVGSTSDSRDFSVVLDCPGSVQPGSRVGVRIDAAQDASSLPGVLPLTTTLDAASGIAIQMVRREGAGEQTLRFGENIVLATGPMNAGKLTLPLRARYIQTRAGRVLPGKADGMATFTIQYN